MILIQIIQSLKAKRNEFQNQGIFIIVTCRIIVVFTVKRPQLHIFLKTSTHERVIFAHHPLDIIVGKHTGPAQFMIAIF